MRIRNIKGITLLQYNSQQIISQCFDDTSFILKVEQNNVYNLIGILHKFGIAFTLRSIGKRVLRIGAVEDDH